VGSFGAGLAGCTGVLIASLVLLSTPAGAQEAAADAQFDTGGDPGTGRRWEVTLVPQGDLYEPYVADPLRPTFMVQRMAFGRTGIAEAGRQRYGLRLGGLFGLVRFHPAGEPDRGVQVNIEAGFLGHFDLDHSYDNIGWDGIYGLIASWRGEGPVTLRFGLHHVSAHVGDEHADRTGRRRIGYTREEVLLGASWRIDPRWRIYAEGGWAHDLRNEELQERGRLQAGLEHESPGRLWKGRLGWYAAVDAAATQERDWRVSTTVQAGLMLPADGRRWRLGLEYGRGRSAMAEYFQDDERYVALGLSLDL
jgi:hypothetical protein